MNQSIANSYMNSILNDSIGQIDVISRLFGSTLVGFYAQDNNPSYCNTYVGYESGAFSVAVNNNVGVGYRAGACNNMVSSPQVESTDNVFVGSLAAYGAKRSSRNVIVGTLAGTQINGDNNVVIGYSNSTNATINTSVSVGSYVKLDGSLSVGIGCSNTLMSSNSAVVGTYISDQSNDNVIFGKNIANSGSRSVIIKTNHSGVYSNLADDLINIQDRWISSNSSNNNYAVTLAADALLIQTTAASYNLMDYLVPNPGNSTLHFVVGQPTPDLSIVSAGVNTIFPYTVQAASNFIVDGNLYVKGSIALGGINAPNPVFNGAVTMCNNLTVGCNLLVGASNVVFNDFSSCNLSHYLTKVTRPLQCLHYQTTSASLSNPIFTTQLFGSNQSVDIFLGVTLTNGNYAVNVTLNDQSGFVLSNTNTAASTPAIMQMFIVRASDTTATSDCIWNVSGQNVVVATQSISQLNWLSTQTLSVTTSGAITGRVFKVTAYN